MVRRPILKFTTPSLCLQIISSEAFRPLRSSSKSFSLVEVNQAIKAWSFAYLKFDFFIQRKCKHFSVTFNERNVRNLSISNRNVHCTGLWRRKGEVCLLATHHRVAAAQRDRQRAGAELTTPCIQHACSNKFYIFHCSISVKVAAELPFSFISSKDELADCIKLFPRLPQLWC